MHLQLSSQLQGKLLYVYYMLKPKNVDFFTTIPGRFGHFQKRAKNDKTGQKIPKMAFFANLSVFPINFSAELPFDQF